MGEGRAPAHLDMLEKQLLRIDASLAGAIPLGLHELRPPLADRLPPVLLVHGATFHAPAIR